ncbi:MULTISPECIES: hypothetical protein [Halomonadaceae]|uniref:hypothetical protein n=1 Tax=Halomonadaceae TaxID=28256 RepID=UPI0015986F9D|nr:MULTISPECIES: hypothetical protein [Halomonas]QJQ96767.1 hypothetical protein HIO72_16760 [Halomonas sp. PA5]
MIGTFEFSAISQRGEPATLVAFAQFTPDPEAPLNGDESFLLGQIRLATKDGRVVDYVEGELISLEDGEIFIPGDEMIFDLLSIA